MGMIYTKLLVCSGGYITVIRDSYKHGVFSLVLITGIFILSQ